MIIGEEICRVFSSTIVLAGDKISCGSCHCELLNPDSVQNGPNMHPYPYKNTVPIFKNISSCHIFVAGTGMLPLPFLSR
jgi:hypothetical protein